MKPIVYTNDPHDPVCKWLEENSGIEICYIDEIDLNQISKSEIINRLCTLDTDDLFHTNLNPNRVDLVGAFNKIDSLKNNNFSLCCRIPTIFLQHELVKTINTINPLNIFWASDENSFSFSFRRPYELLLKTKEKRDLNGNIKVATSIKDFSFFTMAKIHNHTFYSKPIDIEQRDLIEKLSDHLMSAWGCNFLETVFLESNGEMFYFYSNTAFRISPYVVDFNHFLTLKMSEIYRGIIWT